jgi:hypothetical protein
MSTVRDILFSDPMFSGCSSHDCIIKKKSGMGTNGSCGCLFRLGRAQIHLLKAGLSTILDKEVVQTGEE